MVLGAHFLLLMLPAHLLDDLILILGIGATAFCAVAAHLLIHRMRCAGMTSGSARFAGRAFSPGFRPCFALLP